MNNIYTKAAKNIAAAFVLLLSLSILAVSAIAAPPNDNFANAQVITGVNNFVNGTNIGSTVEAGEPIHALNRGGGSVWYKYTAPGNGVLRINTGGSDFNTILAVYAGSALANLKLVAANNNYDENGTWGQYSNVRVGASTGDVFYIVVDGNNNNDANGVASGTIKLNYFFENAATNDNFANAIHISGTGKQMTTTTNVGASKEVGEPNHAGNAGGKSVWYRWTTSSVAKTYAFTVENYAVDQVSPNKSVLFAIYTGSSVDALTPVAKGENYYYSKIVFTPVPNTVYYIALDGKDNGTGSMTGTFSLSIGINTSDKVPDIDGDGKADLAVYRPTTGIFYTSESITDRLRGYQWGTNGDKPLIVDKDRDGEVDYTVFRPDSGVWYTDRSSTTANEIFGWGISTDIPMFRRRTSTAGLNDAISTVFRQSTGTWYLYYGSNASDAINWGMNGDIPVLADFTGDGVDDLTVFRPSTGKWYILLNQNPIEFQEVQFGINGDKPVVADYDGDGRADIAVYRPSNGTWYVLRSSDGAVQIVQFGLSTDKPQPADYDGDSKADYAIYRNGIWWIYQSSTGTAKVAAFGLANDIPITAPAN